MVETPLRTVSFDSSMLSSWTGLKSWSRECWVNGIFSQ